MKVDRKAVRSNLLNLIEFGYDIEYRKIIQNVSVRDIKTGEIVKDSRTGRAVMEEKAFWSDFYIKRKFTEGE